jgi:hypothetical protein
MLAIPALGRQRQEDHESNTSLSNKVRLCLKFKKKKKKPKPFLQRSFPLKILGSFSFLSKTEIVQNFHCRGGSGNFPGVIALLTTIICFGMNCTSANS